MKLSELINIAGLGETEGADDLEITGIYSDSRQVEPGSLFVAVKGTLVDGHDYIDKAIELGAVAIVGEHPAVSGESNVTGKEGASGHPASFAGKDIVFFTVPDSAEALGHLASAWYGEPSAQMTVVGVTGTNGKTTIATLLYDLFRKLGYKA